MGQAAEQTGATIKATQATTTKLFTDTTDTYTARDADTETVAGVNGRTLNVTFKDLTLVNNSTNQLSSVINAETGTLTFTGDKLTLKKKLVANQPASGNQAFINNKKLNGTTAATGTLTFDTAVSMEGSVINGMYLQGTATFKQGYDMVIDRTGQTGGSVVTGVFFQSGGTLTTEQPTSMTVTASANDTALRGIGLTTGETLSTKALTMTLNGNKSLTNFQGILDATNVKKADMTVDGPLSITMKTGQEARALDLRGKRNYVFADAAKINLSDVTTAYGLYTSSQVEFQGNVDMTLDATGDSWGIYADSEAANVTLKNAVIKFTGDDKTVDKTAIYLQSQAKLEAVSLETNAKQALFAEGGSSIRVTGDLIASERESAIDAYDDGSNIVVNADGTGKVQFWGSTGIAGNSTLEMNVGSGNAAEDSYWSVSQESRLTKLSVASNAALNFLVTPDMVKNLANKAIVTSIGKDPKDAVLLHSDSKIALAGTGFGLDQGLDIPLIYSDAGIALDTIDNLLKAGTKLNELKTDLTLERLKSQARIETNQLSKDTYDLLMKDNNTLVAEFAPQTNPDPDKPNPDPDKPGTDPDKPGTTERVNEQTDALIQSSLTAASTLFAADELLIDSTIKSRQGVRQTGPFAAAKVGKYDLDVSGSADSTVISGLLGYAFNVQDSEVGGFMEMGHGTYDTKTADVGSLFGVATGDGKHNYVGFGVYGNYVTPVDWLHVTGYVKGGWLRSEFAVDLGGVDEDFDRNSNYWGAHLGVYGEFAMADKFKNRTFINYFYDGREGENYRSKGGVEYHLDALNLHRAQVGSVFEYAYTSTLRPYVALTYEYAFKADAKGKFTDQDGSMALNAADLEGSTGIASMGWTYQNEAKSFEFDIGLNGYVGKRQGVSAQAQAAWKF
ncbi:autotransporter outer membrane beta-barrel domain-containing protein [Sutterella wadsworthensis]|uniref:autotransporter outer membrane beta-barrel domain-containing protein n=1 Tax=Sutterella wadsworthensis TaxID=40545 RepID=UPI001F0F00B7|nr:autotransporter outer membrane beta-barrel domain-containing protein [Sutterella wadsworthensis]